jgi:hypothetical protein
MNSFWGYAGADLFAIVVIGGVSALSLFSAYLFVKNYGH